MDTLKGAFPKILGRWGGGMGREMCLAEGKELKEQERGEKDSC